MTKTIIIIVLAFLCFLGKVNEVRRGWAYQERIIQLQTIIESGEHCESLCVELWEKAGC